MTEDTQVKIVVKGDASRSVDAQSRVKSLFGGLIGTLNTVMATVGKVISSLGVVATPRNPLYLPFRTAFGCYRVTKQTLRQRIASFANREQYANSILSPSIAHIFDFLSLFSALGFKSDEHSCGSLTVVTRTLSQIPSKEKSSEPQETPKEIF